MLGISTTEFLALAVIAMIVVGPERLPRYAAQAARFLQRARLMAMDAKRDVRQQLGPEFDDITLADLNPRTAVRKHLLEPIQIDSLDDDGAPTRRSAQPRPSRPQPPRPAGDPPPYDPDTT